MRPSRAKPLRAGGKKQAPPAAPVAPPTAEIVCQAPQLTPEEVGISPDHQLAHDQAFLSWKKHFPQAIHITHRKMVYDIETK